MYLVVYGLGNAGLTAYGAQILNWLGQQGNIIIGLKGFAIIQVCRFDQIFSHRLRTNLLRGNGHQFNRIEPAGAAPFVVIRHTFGQNLLTRRKSSQTVQACADAVVHRVGGADHMTRVRQRKGQVHRGRIHRDAQLMGARCLYHTVQREGRDNIARGHGALIVKQHILAQIDQPDAPVGAALPGCCQLSAQGAVGVEDEGDVRWLNGSLQACDGSAWRAVDTLAAGQTASTSVTYQPAAVGIE